jgi:hypothetical protein
METNQKPVSSKQLIYQAVLDTLQNLYKAPHPSSWTVEERNKYKADIEEAISILKEEINANS